MKNKKTEKEICDEIYNVFQKNRPKPLLTEEQMEEYGGEIVGGSVSDGTFEIKVPFKKREFN